jgi:hypothetical protein
MKQFLLLFIAILVFLALAGYVLYSSKSNHLAEGFQHSGSQHSGSQHSGSHHSGFQHSGYHQSNNWNQHRYNPPVFHGRYGPSTYGGMNDYGYFPIYTEYEYPVYYVDSRNYIVSDEHGILYYLTHPYELFRRIFY